MIHFPVSKQPLPQAALIDTTGNGLHLRIYYHHYFNKASQAACELTNCCEVTAQQNRSSDLHSLYITILMLINSYVCIERFIILLLLLKMNGIILGNETYVQFPNSNKLLNLGFPKGEAIGSVLCCTLIPALLLPEKEKKRKRKTNNQNK